MKELSRRGGQNKAVNWGKYWARRKAAHSRHPGNRRLDRGCGDRFKRRSRLAELPRKPAGKAPRPKLGVA